MDEKEKHDHELDRRYQDQEFKLGIVRQIAQVETALKINTDETRDTKESLDNLQSDFRLAIYGNLNSPGLARQVENLWKFLKFGLVPLLLVTFFFGEQLNPILRDWLYDKTHLKIFYSPAEQFKKEKETSHVKHYHYYIRSTSPE